MSLVAKMREDAWANMSKPEGVAPQVWRRVQNGRASRAEVNKVLSKAGWTEAGITPSLLSAPLSAAQRAQAGTEGTRKPVGISPQTWRAYEKGRLSGAMERKVRSRL